MKAFPGEKDKRFGQDNDCNEGMDLRDYLAAKAMNSIINAMIVSMMNDKCEKAGCNENVIAKMSYQYADAMMKARNV